MSKEDRRSAMLDCGAILMICPHCKEETPVYAQSKEGSGHSSMCLHCDESIQVVGELRPVKYKMAE